MCGDFCKYYVGGNKSVRQIEVWEYIGEEVDFWVKTRTAHIIVSLSHIE